MQLELPSRLRPQLEKPMNRAKAYALAAASSGCLEVELSAQTPLVDRRQPAELFARLEDTLALLAGC